MKILFIRFSSIGDIVLTTPLLRCLRRQIPEAKIHYLTKAQFAPLLSANPHIDQLHLLEDDLEKILPALKKEKFDFIADLHHNLRTSRVKAALKGTKLAAFPKKNFEKWVAVNFRVNLMPDASIVERYFETLKPIGVHNDGGGLEYYIPEKTRISNEDIPTSHWAGYVGCVIGGSYPTKQLPLEQWQRFCALSPYPIVLLGGPDDRELGRQIAEQDPVKIYNSCGKFNLNESAGLIERARVIVSNDTGLMHIAAAFQKPIISLWGNTSPELGMFPYYGGNNLKNRISPLSVILERKNLACHPCSKLGYQHCPRGHFKCMRELDMAFAVESVKKFWKSPTV
ncbi:MAG: glycosyltransferase family 9 protein [Bacteroidetes bacterium]|nr:glycosyltransferase family 9 protein [Bacteroidota bacterium]